MATANFGHFMNGPVVVTWNALPLGFSEDGVPISIEPKYDEIPSDDMGGRAGTPSDIQQLGGLARIDVPLSKYDKAEVEKLTSFRKGGSAGVFNPIGSFVFQDDMKAELLLNGIYEDLIFANAYIKGAMEFNSGTKWRRYMLRFEALVSRTTLSSITLENRTLFGITTTTTTTTT